ncbi:unnamed protein product [Prorocentrum cordatum]|uniref:Ribosomal protein L29 n=1 Tax=Prorocentrum cordatum TaxID=2364126 RepID=A0ABN9PHS5_9DINO|nr:unnamed protein product [Polarella glacialis]
MGTMSACPAVRRRVRAAALPALLAAASWCQSSCSFAAPVWYGAAAPPRERRDKKVEYLPGGTPADVTEKAEVQWWEGQSRTLEQDLQARETFEHIEVLRTSMTEEDLKFDQEIENVIISGKRALLRLRMQVAAEMPGIQRHLFRKIKKTIARAMTLRRQREIARGVTKEQSRRMRRRKRLEVKMQYEIAYGREDQRSKSRRWLRHMGRIV